MKKNYFTIFLIFVCCASGLAYTRITASSGETPKWPSMPVSYWINERGSSQIANGSEFAAVLASFQAWENVTTADVRFSYRGTTPVAGVGRDGLNVVSFVDSGTPLGSSTLAATFSYFRSEIGSNGLIQIVVDDVDIVFNPALQFSTSGEDNKFDIQSVLTHEVGHLLGLDHSGLVSSTMGPFAAASQLDQRKLAYDDIAGITEAYPRTSATAGLNQIRGVIRAGGVPVLGAHVVAVSGGNSTVSALSQTDGSYVLRFLPPGQYKVFAEPLDLPVAKSNIGGSYYANGRTDFGTTFFGNVSTDSDAQIISLTASSGTATANIDTLPASPTGLNLTRPGFGVRLARGVSGLLTVGGEDITPGAFFAASSPGIFLGTPSFGGRIASVASTSARMDFSIAPNAPLGPINVAVHRGTAASIVAGALVVTDPPPRPAGVAPASGSTEGGTPVTISGTNFRPGAQVYFGGLAASAVDILDSGTILANAPQNSPGPSNVVVVNSDGTWGSAVRAYTYDALPPIVTRITPSSGPPATVVTIEGENFDSLLQNVTVHFNGNTGRVISTTARVIQAVVPYGAGSGPISVTVFGRAVIGPVFNVTAAASSTNLAIARFNFIDASSAGGGIPLAFNSSDDGIASIPLPFNFSLFRDIYLAGSPVSVTTNGFLSLEPLSAAEFQNGSLPGQTVVRPSGTNGVIPPSLIAPFWDDLILKGGSAVSTRTVGISPNRMFVVQWSNISILDEEGRDQNASLTFQVVLFEGSNDIQFLYSTMNGPRSDGSSATIGMQDLKRTTGLVSGYNQPIVSAEYFKTYHFENGGYTELSADATPPLRPIVTDEGVLTANRTQLLASWFAVDAESGIREFQYAIGTTPGGSDIKAFTATTHNSVAVTGLNLQSGTTYYFAIKALNGAGLVGETGVSDGIRYDAAYQPQIKVIAAAPQSDNEFSGVAMLAPTAMTVILRAYGANGQLVFGPGIRNPATVSLEAGQQNAKLISELLGIQSFEGWVEVEASASGLGIFTATGAWDTSTLDGAVARETSSDFVLFHAGASAFLVNPSSLTANVVMTSLTTKATQSFSIPPKGRVVTTLESAVRVQSSEALAAIERSASANRLAVNSAVPVSEAQSELVFPHAVVGAGYRSTVRLANVSDAIQTVQVGFGAVGNIQVIQPYTVTEVLPIVGLVPGMTTGALRVTMSSPSAVKAIVGVLDIENESGLVTMGARPATTEFAFPHVANGNGLFTGLALAAGSAPTQITIDVFGPAGGTPKSATITLAANQQLARLVSELVAGTATQVGGYIRIRSDQPIWAWEIYGSDNVMASGPPL